MSKCCPNLEELLTAGRGPSGVLLKGHLVRGENAEEGAKALGQELAAALSAECVAVIGRKVILYRRSSRKDFPHIKF